VAFVSLDLTWVGQFFDRARLPLGSTLDVVDPAGRVLAHHPDGGTWTGKVATEAPLVRLFLAARGEGTAQVEGLDGIPRLYAFTALGGPPAGERVFMSVGIPRGLAFA